MITSLSRCSPLFLVVLLMFHSVPIHAQQTLSIANGPQVLDVQGGKIRVVPVATGLYHAWSIAFPDARTILVAERNGKLRMIREGTLLPEPVWTSPTASGDTGDALHF